MVLGNKINNADKLIIKIIGDKTETVIDLTKYRDQNSFNIQLHKTLQKLFESKIYRNYHVDVTSSSLSQKGVILTFVPIPGAA